MTSSKPTQRLRLSRREFLGTSLGAGAGLLLAACSSNGPSSSWVQPGGPAVELAEQARRGTGKTTTVTLTAQPSSIDLAGTTAPTFAFGSTPAPLIRIGAGDTLHATVRNQLPVDTSMHWHGIALRNNMDGVPPVTQAPISPGTQFDYQFIARDPGTYWFHPHVGTQLDRGLYGAIIVEDPHEPLAYDDEWVIILDDWLDGVTATPEEVLAELRRGMADMGDSMFMRMGNTLMGATSTLLGGDAGDVYYPYYLINGKPAQDPAIFTGTPGQKIRLRIINAGGDTAFRFAIGGHRLTVTHTDGYRVRHSATSSILIGMGERYDALITLGDGVFPMVAAAEGKRARGFALVRTGSGTPPASDTSVPELGSDAVLTAAALNADPAAALIAKTPDCTITLSLTGDMTAYDWAINGKPFDMNHALDRAHAIRAGERVQLAITNQTKMWHPFHVHGHTYQHTGGGPRKDTSIILPGQTLTADFDADNPGLWIAHCHNIYHAESGMTTTIGYQA